MIRKSGLGKLAIVATVATVASAALADTTLGQIDGVGFNSSDTAAECCAHLGTLHNQSGNITDMQKACFAMGGNVVKNVHQASSGYCAPSPSAGRAYKYDCRAPMVGDCVKWDNSAGGYR
jgi:hypothetical protein